MKIIIRSNNELKKCFVQVRDIRFLAERYNVEKLKRYALGNSKHEETDFIEIKDMRLAKVIEENQSIVDFSEMVNFDELTLGRVLLLTHEQFYISPVDEKQKVRDLQDILSFKKGELNYQIPVLLTDVVFENEDMILGRSTLPGYYMLRSKNGSLDLDNYEALNVNPLFWMVYPEEEMESHNIIRVDDCLLIHFDVKKKHFGKIKE